MLLLEGEVDLRLSLKKIYFLFFSLRVRAYMKGNEMLLEIIDVVVLWVWFQCYTGEGVKIV